MALYSNLAPSSASESSPARAASLAALRRSLSATFDLLEMDVTVGESTFLLLKVRDTNTLVDTIDPVVFTRDERLPYWGDLWSSAIELARYCLSDCDLEGRRVLELGCGLGLAGIAAARAGAYVTMTDYDDNALAFARYNSLLNLPHDVAASRVHVRPLDWRVSNDIGRFDVVLGADVVYERRNFLPILETLRRVLEPPGVAIFTEPSRSIGEDFFTVAASEGWTVFPARRAVHFGDRESMIVRCELRRCSTFPLSNGRKGGG